MPPSARTTHLKARSVDEACHEAPSTESHKCKAPTVAHALMDVLQKRRTAQLASRLASAPVRSSMWSGPAGAANIGITNFSRSSGHERAGSNSERARGLRRLLQHMIEVNNSIMCRANSHQGLVVRGSRPRRETAPSRSATRATGCNGGKNQVKIDARATQAMDVLQKSLSCRVNVVG